MNGIQKRTFYKILKEQTQHSENLINIILKKLENEGIRYYFNSKTIPLLDSRKIKNYDLRSPFTFLLSSGTHEIIKVHNEDDVLKLKPEFYFLLNSYKQD